MNRDTWAAILATIAVVAVVAVGWHALGGPGTQRQVQSDFRAVRTLAELAQQIVFTWNSSDKVLPADLEKFPDALKQNPVTNKAFIYRRKSNSEYELCATFVTDSRNLQTQNTYDFWAHPKGDYCFQFDASQPVPQMPYVY
jgi:hypothetical protein